MIDRWSRRDFLRSAALLGLAPTVFSRLARATESAAPRRPRMLIQIHIVGGIDAILSTNPKTRDEVASEVDVPYQPEHIGSHKTGTFGPLFGDFDPILDQMAIVNGVLCSTVAHYYGATQSQQLRRVFPDNGIGLTGTLGELLPGSAPFSDVRFARGGWAPRALGRSLFVEYDTGPAFVAPGTNRTIVSELVQLAGDAPTRQQIEDQLRALPCTADGCAPLEAMTRFLSQVGGKTIPDIPAITPDAPLPKGAGALKMTEVSPTGRDIIRETVFLLENQLANAVYIVSPFACDTHFHNLTFQTACASLYRPFLRSLVAELSTRRTADGVLLSDQVGIVLLSELGRFPVKNRYDGKDHFPEIPVMLMGPGIRPGKYGSTDKMMMSQPISFKTGLPSSSTTDAVPALEDFGTTILHWFGIEDAASVGYLGKRLDFLLA